MSLTITEAWIRERVQLTHDNLEDVRSLSLPGTYQEKIANLGNALASFSRLKQLDLSRNALQGLQGLQYLTLLEKLNLYYNNVSTLQELSRLRHNTSLQELDLRLNPVTKNEPDYRLYLVHMLPNLRKLDDRSVRESERKSALLHFDTDQATSMTEHAPSPARETGRSELPRTKHIRGLVGRSAIEEDDSDLLDLLARTDGDLSKPRPITGSASGIPSVDVQSSEDYQRLYSQRTPPHRSLGPQSSAGQFTERDRGSYHTDVMSGTLQAANTSLASDSTGSLLDMDPLEPLGDSFHSTHLSPARPSPPLTVRGPLTTLHDDPPSPADTNTLVEEISRSTSQTWQSSDSLLEERKVFEVEHQDLLSPSDTISLMEEGITDFGNVRLSFSPLEGKRKLDFAGDSPNITTSRETVRSPSDISSLVPVSPPRSHSMSTLRSDYSLSGLSDVDYAELPRIPASQLEKGPIKAGDIYSSIRLQTISRAKTLSQTTVLTSSPDSQATVSPTLTDITTASSATNTSHPLATVRGNPLVDQPPLPESSGAGGATQHPVTVSDTSLHHVHHLLTPFPEPSQHLPDAERAQRQQGHQRSKVEVDSRGRADPNLRFTDEDDAYTAYSSKVNFTPNPKSSDRAETLSSSSYDMHPSSGSGDRSGDTYSEPPPVQRVSTKNGTSTPGPAQSTFMDNLLGLVDRYWNGSKSLHAHSKFQVQAHGLLERLLAEVSTTSQEQMDRLQLDVARYAQENVTLRSKLGPVGRMPAQTFGGADLQTALDKAQKDVELLRRELQDTMAQNRDLQSQLVESRTRSSEPRTLSHAGTRGDLPGEAEKLKVENDKLKLQLKHFSQLQELATMLQESHKSLVTTNDHLLKELEETKQRHLEEVKQLHWSYSQLKQTTDISSIHAAVHTPTRTSAHSTSGEGSPGGGYSPGKKVRGFSYSNGTM